MIAWLAGCGLAALAGWFGHRAWVKEVALRRERMLDAQMHFNAAMDAHYTMTPYEAALSEYDRRIDNARTKHLKVRHIMDARKSFVLSELRRAADDYRNMQQASPELINRVMRGAQNAYFSSAMDDKATFVKAELAL